MYCPSCGTDLPDNARFCGNCRHQINSTQAPESQQQSTHASQPDPVQLVNTNVNVMAGNNEVAPMLKWGIVAGSLILPFIGIIMGLIYLLGKNSFEKKSVGKLWLIVGVVAGVFWTISSMNSGVYY